MRTKRILLALFAPALAGALSVTALPAEASAPAAARGTQLSGSVVPGSGAADGVGDRAKQRRNVTIDFRQPGSPQRFNLVGKVGPKANSKRVRVILFRSNSARGRYTKVRTTRTNARAGYAFNGLSRTGFFKARVPGTRKFKPGTSKTIKIVRR